LNNTLGLIVHILIFGGLYYILLHRFLEGVVIRRLTKTSFRMGITDCLDLGVAYNLCILSCLYYLFYHSIFNITTGQYDLRILDFPPFTFNEKNSLLTISLIGSLLFIGRIILKAKGCLYGRLHFSAIFISSSIFMAAEIILAFSQTHSVEILYENLYLRIDSFINFFNIFGLTPAICSICLVTFFEFLLSILGPTQKNILIISDKFPSDFRVITGYEQHLGKLLKNILFKERNLKNKLENESSYSQIVRYCMDHVTEEEDNPDLIDPKHIYISPLKFYRKICNDDAINIKLNQMLYPKRYNIKKIVCVTRSLVMIDVLTDILKEILLLRNIELKVIIATPNKTIKDYELAMEKTPWSLGNFIRYKNWQMQKYKEGYCKRYRKLRKYQLDGLLCVVEYYLGKTVFVIVEYNDAEKEMLFSIRDSGSMKKRIGLFTNEPHVISHFESIVENILGNHQET